MTRILTIIFLLSFLTISAAAQKSLKVGSAAPAFMGTSLDGKAIDLSDLRGSVVVVTFWSTRCQICHHEIPKLNRFAGQYDPTRVVFLALSMESEEKISAYLKYSPFNFQILPNSFAVVLKYADRDRNDNLDMGFPSFFVIDQRGLVQYRSSGYDKTAALDTAINKLVLK